MILEADESNIGLTAAALLFKNKTEGETSSLIDEATAAKLLGQIDIYPSGQGGIHILIPLRALEEAGLRMDSWREMSFTTIQRAQGLCYNIPSTFAENGLLPVLEKVANCTWEQARETAKKYGSPKAGRKIE